MEKYSTKDAERTQLLFHYYRKSVKKEPYLTVYKNEMNLMRTVRRIEAYGMRWDMAMSARLLRIVRKDRDKFRTEAFKLAKKEFNLLSHKQLAEIMFGDLGLRVLAYTEKGNPNLQKDELVKYDHPLLTQVLRYRMTVKMDAYIRKFLGSACWEKPYWVIHPSILQHGTMTGRWSVIDPPLQTTPALDTGRRSHYIIDIRRCFVPRKGRIFYMLDYSQIEIKLFVHFSGNPEMRAIIERGGDVHTEMGILLTGVKEDDPEFSHVRKMIKMVNFGLIFGAGVQKMHDITHEDRRKIEEFVDMYQRKFKVKQFMDKIIEQAVRDGYIMTHEGRRIPVDSQRAYAAVNYLIQGTAAGVLKKGIIDCANYIYPKGGEILLSMHDEIIFEVPEEHDHVENLNELKKRLEVWDNVFSVPLRVDLALSASSWSEEFKVENASEKTIHRSLDKALRLRELRRSEAPKLRDLRVIR
jgi:DNA polymerase-1